MKRVTAFQPVMSMQDDVNPVQSALWFPCRVSDSESKVCRWLGSTVLLRIQVDIARM
ncbi:MAG: hypothetical protein GY820_29700 [Gammaproteobacteria bacterium]|nr:hypothetical protein [Gammaproteobacteria bacterium]